MGFEEGTHYYTLTLTCMYSGLWRSVYIYSTYRSGCFGNVIFVTTYHLCCALSLEPLLTHHACVFSFLINSLSPACAIGYLVFLLLCLKPWPVQNSYNKSMINIRESINLMLQYCLRKP